MSSKIWDAVVLGAGPAGSIAARMLALRGFSVLLADKQQFPRAKVCGCCLNASALETLAQCGLAELPDALNARDLTALHVHVGERNETLQLPGNKVVSREALDAALVNKAIEAGVEFLPAATAKSVRLEDDTRVVDLHSMRGDLNVRGRVVLVATGLNAPFLDDDTELRSEISQDSRMGLGATFKSAPEFYRDGCVFMACGAGGYAGLVRLEDGRLNIAAALDVSYLRSCSSPGDAIAGLLSQSALPPIDGVSAAHWHGTALLTRRRKQIAAERLLVLGDAAGYVEPFTGEGMAWAILSGMLVAKLLPAKTIAWSVDVEHEWMSAHRRFIQQRQFACKVVARVLRMPRVSKAALSVLHAAPSLSRAIIASTQRPALA